MESGLFRQLEQLPEKEVNRWISGSGSFVTDLSAFLFRTKSNWNFHALYDCVVYSINYDDYMMLNQFVQKWNDFLKAFISKCAIYMKSRVLGLISLSSEERYQLFFGQNRVLFSQVPQHRAEVKSGKCVI